MTDPRYNPATGHGVECLCDGCISDGLWVVQKWVHDLIRSHSRPYIVAGWEVKPEDRVWREDRTKVTYRVTQ